MIDYTKILLKNIDVAKLKNKLPSILNVAEDTGEILGQEIKLHFCTIRINKNNIVEFVGSIHKFYNEMKGVKAPNHKEFRTYKGYNGNLFTLKNILEVRDYLCDLFACTPQQMEFQNIEFGINANVDFNPQIFIKGLLFHNGKGFEFNHNRNYAQVGHQRFYIKIYNKSLQYRMSKHTLRFELKLIKSREIIKTGIKTFADVDAETLTKAKKMLLQRLNEVVYYDNTISKKTLTQSKQNALNRYSNIVYWLDEVQPQHRNRPKKKLNNLIVNYSDNLKKKLKQKIIEKCVIINRPFEQKKDTSKNKKCVIINSSNIGVNITQVRVKKRHQKQVV